MKKILMTAAVVLVAGSPLAFAANNSKNVNTSEPTSYHCTYAGEKAGLCRQDSHKTDATQNDAERGARGVSSKG